MQFFYDILLLVKNKLIGHNDFEDSYPEDSNNKFSIYGFKNDFKINYFIDDLNLGIFQHRADIGYPIRIQILEPVSNPNLDFMFFFVYYMLI